MDVQRGNDHPASREEPPGLLLKFLRIFTVIHPGESLTVLFLFLNIFLIGVAYSMLKPVRTALILTDYTAEQEAYLYAVVAFLLVFVIKGFSYLSSKYPRQKLIANVTLFFISNLALFYVLNETGTSVKILGPVFWVWLSIFNVFIIAQFWAFSNDVYAEEAGKRLFPIVMFGQNMGFYLGSKATIALSDILSAFQLMLLAGGLLFICIVLTLAVHRRETGRRHARRDRAPGPGGAEPLKEETKPLDKGGGFRVIFRSRYLILVAFLILALNYVNTTGQYMKSSVWRKAATEATETGKIQDTEEAWTQFLTKTEADFQAYVNLFAWLIQLFLVSRIFRWIGVRGAMLFLPFIAFGGYFLIGFGATFAIVKWTKIAENSTDYSLMNTVKQALFLVTSREAKYKAKAAIDTFFVRAGDVLQALTVFVGTTYLALKLESFAIINVVVAAVWILLSFLTIREHRKLSAEQVAHQEAGA